jgi:1-pyrroline-5-carboxylate dehydrogenase
VTAGFGQTHPQYIGGQKRFGDVTFEDRSPIDTNICLGKFQKGTRQDAKDAIAAARAAFPAWSHMPYQERNKILHRAGDLIHERVLDISALVVIETGKSRVEAMGEVEESADLIHWYARMMEENNGFAIKMGSYNPAKDENVSVLRPYGVWAVVAVQLLMAGCRAAAPRHDGTMVAHAPDTPDPMMIQGFMTGIRRCHHHGGARRRELVKNPGGTDHLHRQLRHRPPLRVHDLPPRPILPVIVRGQEPGHRHAQPT